MTGPFASYILDAVAKDAAIWDFRRRKKRNRGLDHTRWMSSERRKKRTRQHRNRIASASRKRNRQ